MKLSARSRSRRGYIMRTATEKSAGFRAAAFQFLAELRDNNDPAWFRPRRALYVAEVLTPFRELIVARNNCAGAS